MAKVLQLPDHGAVYEQILSNVRVQMFASTFHVSCPPYSYNFVENLTIFLELPTGLVHCILRTFHWPRPPYS